jgi:hypothetical protein
MFVPAGAVSITDFKAQWQIELLVAIVGEEFQKCLTPEPCERDIVLVRHCGQLREFVIVQVYGNPMFRRRHDGSVPEWNTV